MKRSFLVLLAAGVLPLFLVQAGASYISLVGSDPAPFEGNFSSACYSNVQIEAPLENDGNGNDFKVRRVIVSGNFSACQGETILLEARMGSTQKSYAFHVFSGAETNVVLYFDTGNGTGDWHKRYPTIVDSRLVANGPLTPPSAKLTEEEISWFVSYFW